MAKKTLKFEVEVEVDVDLWADEYVYQIDASAEDDIVAHLPQWLEHGLEQLKDWDIVAWDGVKVSHIKEA